MEFRTKVLQDSTDDDQILVIHEMLTGNRPRHLSWTVLAGLEDCAHEPEPQAPASNVNNDKDVGMEDSAPDSPQAPVSNDDKGAGSEDGARTSRDDKGEEPAVSNEEKTEEAAVSNDKKDEALAVSNDDKGEENPAVSSNARDSIPNNAGGAAVSACDSHGSAEVPV
jgi:hypothetical protein